MDGAVLQQCAHTQALPGANPCAPHIALELCASPLPVAAAGRRATQVLQPRALLRELAARHQAQAPSPWACPCRQHRCLQLWVPGHLDHQ